MQAIALPFKAVFFLAALVVMAPLLVVGRWLP